METEFIYDTDLGTFKTTAGGTIQRIQGPLTVTPGTSTEHQDLVAGNVQVITADLDGNVTGDGGGAVGGIQIATSEIHFQDGQIITQDCETTIPHDGSELINPEVTTILTADQIPILTAGSHIVQPDVEISPEDELRSSERLDRSSPDLWPQDLSSAAQHILAKNSLKTNTEQQLGIWAQGLDPEDINLLHQFGSLTSSSLVEEVKKLQNIAYQLDLEESKETTRGKLLHVLDEEEVISKSNGSSRNHSSTAWQ